MAPEHKELAGEWGQQPVSGDPTVVLRALLEHCESAAASTAQLGRLRWVGLGIGVAFQAEAQTPEGSAYWEQEVLPFTWVEGAVGAEVSHRRWPSRSLAPSDSAVGHSCSLPSGNTLVCGSLSSAHWKGPR